MCLSEEQLSISTHESMKKLGSVSESEELTQGPLQQFRFYLHKDHYSSSDSIYVILARSLSVQQAPFGLLDRNVDNERMSLRLKKILFYGRVATGKFAQSPAIAAAQYAMTASSSLATSVSGPSSDWKFYRSDSPNSLMTSVPILMMMTIVLLMYQRL